MAAHCSGCVFTVCVCSLLCVCTLDGLNAEHKFRAWVTIVGHMSHRAGPEYSNICLVGWLSIFNFEIWIFFLLQDKTKEVCQICDLKLAYQVWKITWVLLVVYAKDYRIPKTCHLYSFEWGKIAQYGRSIAGSPAFWMKEPIANR